MDFSLLISIFAIIISILSYRHTLKKSKTDINLKSLIQKNNLKENILDFSFELEVFIKTVMNDEPFIKKDLIIDSLEKSHEGIKKMYFDLMAEKYAKKILTEEILVTLSDLSSDLNELKLVYSKAKLNYENKDYLNFKQYVDAIHYRIFKRN